MARWSSPTPATHGLREEMAVRAEAFAASVTARLGPNGGRSRIFDALAERWRSDEPMTVHGWELPATARPGIHANSTVTVNADGTLEVAESGALGPDADVVMLRPRPPSE